MVSKATIRRWLSRIRQYIQIKNPKGYYRTIWVTSALKNEQGHAQNCGSEVLKSVHRVAQRCAPTNNNTITENNRRTIASPSPLPACGQAPATLQYRRQQDAADLGKFEKYFGRAPRQAKLTPQQFEQRRQQKLVALRIGECRRPGDG